METKELIARGKELLRNADPAAIACFEEAVEKGDVKANYYLATIYRFGKGAEVDQKKALELYKKAAKADSRMALYQLGKLSEKGKCGMKKSKEEAKKYYTRSAELGYSKAMLEIAQILEKEYDTNKVREENNTKKIYKQIIDNKGNTDGLIYTVESSLSNQEAVNWYEKLAAKGDEDVIIHLAGIYEIGKGIEKNEEKADELYASVAEKGNEKVMLKLAKKYQFAAVAEKEAAEKEALLGRSVAANEHLNKIPDLQKKSLYWYQKLYNAGDIKAPYQISLMYEESGNQEEAKEWCRIAAEAGNNEAKHKLANSHEAPVNYIVGQEISDKREPRK